MDKSGGDSYDFFNGDYDMMVIVDMDKFVFYFFEKFFGDMYMGIFVDV